MLYPVLVPKEPIDAIPRAALLRALEEDVQVDGINMQIGTRHRERKGHSPGTSPPAYGPQEPSALS
jgi:hypothetical protein